MKKLLLIACLIFSTTLFSEQYITIGVGTNCIHKTCGHSCQKIGYKLAGSYGYKFDNAFRLEAELSYRDGGNKRKHGIKFHSLSYMANVCYDIGVLQTWGATPYIGAGVGICSNTSEIRGIECKRHKDERFAYQIIVGAKYPIADKLELSGQYNCHVGQSHAKNHSFSAALIRSF